MRPEFSVPASLYLPTFDSLRDGGYLSKERANLCPPLTAGLEALVADSIRRMGVQVLDTPCQPSGTPSDTPLPWDLTASPSPTPKVRGEAQGFLPEWMAVRPLPSTDVLWGLPEGLRWEVDAAGCYAVDAAGIVHAQCLELAKDSLAPLRPPEWLVTAGGATSALVAGPLAASAFVSRALGGEASCV